jgi:ceramide glucosyltransferase
MLVHLFQLASQYAAWLFALLAACGLGYLGLSLWSEMRWLSEPRPAPADFTPPVSILKPLRGTDRQMYEGFRSHCLQDYPDYEILFGVSRADDEAIAEVERLQREFPERRIRLLLCTEELGSNRKVSTLVQMLRHAAHDYILINDSDIRVAPDYLRRIVAPMHDPQVGLVTTLYRAGSGGSLASRVEAITIATDFAGGVLCARQMEGGLHFGLGSTLAFPRAACQSIGGLEALVDHLADDHELGKMIAAKGYRCILSDVVVETFLPGYGWRAMIQHQLRWARTVRDLRKWGYLGVLMTFALPWTLLAALCASGSAWSLALLGVVAAARFASAALLAGPILHDRHALADLWLVPLRDIISLAIWFASFAGDTILWRGERFHLKDGRLTKI